MTRLLHKPLRAFIIFTCVILVLSIPVYFFLVESVWINELDDHNEQMKDQITAHFSKLDPNELSEKIAFWNQIQINSEILPASAFHKDSLYFVEKDVLDDKELEKERFRGLYAVVSLGDKLYSITIETNIEEVHETIWAISVITGVFMVLLTLGFILLNWRLSKKIWRPFTDTLEKLKKFDLTHAGMIDLEKTDIREFAELNEALMKLIYNNISTYKQQKEFIENASHELQTPLALLKTKIDLLVQDAALTEAQRTIIESLDNSVSRVGRINKNLLLLARIENSAYEAGRVDVSALTKAMVNNFTEFAENKSCTLVAVVAEGVAIQANESLLEILLSNLLSNSIRHGVPNSEITLRLNSDRLIISNRGEGPLNEKKLFKRFSAASVDNPGTGLGLAIVKEIADRYHWQVSYHYADKHHVFSVHF